MSKAISNRSTNGNRQLATRECAVEHHNCRIAYLVRGDGPAVLLIQGVGVQGDAWMPQINELASRYTCLSFDNRGMGQSQPKGTTITVEQMADDALAVLNAEGITSAHIIGHSLGGLVALQLALSARKRVRSLSLLCTFSSGQLAAPPSLRMIWLGLRSRVGTRRMRRKGFLQLVSPPEQVVVAEAQADYFAALFGHDLADHPPIESAQLRAMRAANLTPRLGELTGIPTLVVSGYYDPIAPPRSGQVLRDGIPGARYVEMADASHGLPITHAARVNALLLEHLSVAAVAATVRESI